MPRFRPRFRPPLAVAALSLLALAAGPPVQVNGPVDIPVANRPARFSGAVGESFRVKMTPGAVTPNRPFALTVQVAAAGRWWRRPRRPELQELAAFARRFEISRPADRERTAPGQRRGRTPEEQDEPDREPAPGVWEFDYLLKLKPGAVERLPPLPLVYYTPAAQPRMPGAFQTAFGEPLPLVLPTPPTSVDAGPPIEAPERFRSIEEGPGVLAAAAGRLPSVAWLVALFLLPPVAAGAGYFAWRLLSPTAAQRARQRRSRAARAALQALAGGGPPERVAAVMHDFLRQRVGLPNTAGSPGEVAASLQRAGSPPDLAGKTAELFRACDIARYGPPEDRGRADLAAAARQLVLSLEAEPWSSAP